MALKPNFTLFYLKLSYSLVQSTPSLSDGRSFYPFVESKMGGGFHPISHCSQPLVERMYL